MAITWSPDLAVGVDEIDTQHKQLFERINALFDACNHGKGRLEIRKTIDFLEEYTETHFSTEESFMKRSAYPGMASHIRHHAQFRTNLAKLREQLDKDGPGIHIIILTNQMVIDWLKNHIRTLDREFGAYLISTADKR